MGEYYYAEVSLKWPTDLPAPGDEAAVEALLEDPSGTPAQVAKYDTIRELYDLLSAASCGGGCSEVDEDGVLSWSDDQASYGIACDEIDSIRTVCRSLGIPYRANDEGKYEIEGETAIWLPGMEQEYSISSSVDGAPVFSVSEFDSLCKDRTPEEALVAVRARLAGPDFYGAPRPTILEEAIG